MYYVGTIIENKKQEFLLEQRPETGLLANMWLFPIEEISKNNFNNCKNGATSRNGKQLTLELDPVTEPLVAEEPVNVLLTMTQLSGKTCLRRSRSYFQSFKMAYLSLYGRNTGELATLESQRWVAAQQFSDYVFPKPQQKWWNCSKRTQNK